MASIFSRWGAGTVLAVGPWCWHWLQPRFGRSSYARLVDRVAQVGFMAEVLPLWVAACERASITVSRLGELPRNVANIASLREPTHALGQLNQRGLSLHVETHGAPLETVAQGMAPFAPLPLPEADSAAAAAHGGTPRVPVTVLMGVPGSGVAQVSEALVQSTKQVEWAVVASRCTERFSLAPSDDAAAADGDDRLHTRLTRALMGAADGVRVLLVLEAFADPVAVAATLGSGVLATLCELRAIVSVVSPAQLFLPAPGDSTAAAPAATTAGRALEATHALPSVRDQCAWGWVGVIVAFGGAARPSPIPSPCTQFTRAGIEWRRCHRAACMARAYKEHHRSGQAEP